MNRPSSVRRKFIKVLPLAPTVHPPANDNEDERLETLAPDVVAILLRDDRTLLAGR